MELKQVIGLVKNCAIYMFKGQCDHSAGMTEPWPCLFHLNLIMIKYFLFIMSTPLGGGHIIFAFSAVRRPDTWFPLI